MTSRPLVFDVFSYNGEPIVELRLQYLAPYVDQFVIVEARETHSGMRKEQLYIEKFAEVFEPYKKKIHFIVIDEFPQMPEDWPSTKGNNAYMRDISYESWYRETYQRDIAKDYLLGKFAQNEFLVICGDADEILRGNVVSDMRKQYFALCDPVYIEMDFYYYNFSWKKKGKWYHAFMINDMGLRKASLSYYRTDFVKNRVVKNAGWHGSYFFNVADLQRKLASFAHRECDVEQNKTQAHLAQCLREGCDISRRGDGEDCVKSGLETLPFAFQEFQKKLVFLQTYS